jgi:hypothetical protein
MRRPAEARSPYPGCATTVPAGCPLTARQFEVLTLVSQGMLYKQIGRELGIKAGSVASHVNGALLNLGLVGAGGARAAIVKMKDSGWLGALPREPQQRDDSRDVTPQQRAYNAEFVRLCREREPLAEATTAVASKLVSVDAAEPFARRDARAPRRPDIDTLLLRMAIALSRAR